MSSSARLTLRSATTILFALLMSAVSSNLFAAEDAPSKQRVVALDVGHTPKRPGAVSARGVTEYKFNQRMVAELKAALEAKGIKVVVVDPGDKGLSFVDSLLERPKLAETGGAELFLSIHHDSVNQKYIRKWDYDGKERPYSDAFRGHSIFVSDKNEQPEKSKKAAFLIGRAMRDAGFIPTYHHNEPIEGENRPLLDWELGVYQFTDLIVLKRNALPAVLFECGVIIHRDEEEDMNDPKVRARIVEALVSAVEAYFKEN